MFYSRWKYIVFYLYKQLNHQAAKIKNTKWWPMNYQLSITFPNFITQLSGFPSLKKPLFPLAATKATQCSTGKKYSKTAISDSPDKFLTIPRASDSGVWRILNSYQRSRDYYDLFIGINLSHVSPTKQNPQTFKEKSIINSICLILHMSNRPWRKNSLCRARQIKIKLYFCNHLNGQFKHIWIRDKFKLTPKESSNYTQFWSSFTYLLISSNWLSKMIRLSPTNGEYSQHILKDYYHAKNYIACPYYPPIILRILKIKLYVSSGRCCRLV